MSKMNEPGSEFRHVRGDLDLTQKELAGMLGLSEKAVQSYEQGWRQAPDAVHRLLTVIHASHCMRKRGETITCWDEKGCPTSVRKNCRAFQLHQGHLCWLLKGTKCNGGVAMTAEQKTAACRKCKVYRQLSVPGAP